MSGMITRVLKIIVRALDIMLYAAELMRALPRIMIRYALPLACATGMRRMQRHVIRTQGPVILPDLYPMRRSSRIIYRTLDMIPPVPVPITSVCGVRRSRPRLIMRGAYTIMSSSRMLMWWPAFTMAHTTPIMRKADIGWSRPDIIIPVIRAKGAPPLPISQPSRIILFGTCMTARVPRMSRLPGHAHASACWTM